MSQTVPLVGHLSCPPMSATATLQVRNPSPFSSTATSKSPSAPRVSHRIAVSCSSVRRRGRPSSFPFALAASNLTLVLRLMLWRSWLAT